MTETVGDGISVSSRVFKSMLFREHAIPRNSWTSSEVQTRRTDISLLLHHRVSNGIRNSRFSQAFVQSLAKVSLQGRARRQITWRLMDADVPSHSRTGRNSCNVLWHEEACPDPSPPSPE